MKRHEVIKEISCSRSHRRTSLEDCKNCEYFVETDEDGVVICGYQGKKRICEVCGHEGLKVKCPYCGAEKI